MKKIPLTQGKFALVDDCDYEYLSQWKWYAQKVRNNIYAGRHTHKDGKRTTVYMHQILAERLGFLNTADHIDRNGLNNQRSNLRDATPKQQNENQGLRTDNASGHRGVAWDKQRSKWRSYINHNGRHVNLGRFNNIESAVKARKNAENKYFTHHES